MAINFINPFRSFGGGGGSPPPFSPADIGADCVVYLDADLMTGYGAGDPITTVENFGSTADWSKIAGTSEMVVESGKKAIHVPVGGMLEGGSLAAFSNWTLYWVLKFGATPSNKYILRTFKFSGSKAIIAGFAGSAVEYYDTPRTTVGTISTSSYQVIKCKVGDTAAGEWRISDTDTDTYTRALIGVNRVVTGTEESQLDGWAAAKAA